MYVFYLVVLEKTEAVFPRRRSMLMAQLHTRTPLTINMNMEWHPNKILEATSTLDLGIHLNPRYPARLSSQNVEQALPRVLLRTLKRLPPCLLALWVLVLCEPAVHYLSGSVQLRANVSDHDANYTRVLDGNLEPQCGRKLIRTGCGND